MVKRNKSILSVVALIVMISSCGPDLSMEIAAEYKNLPQELDFNIHVKPILSDKCFACHGPDKGKIEAGLQLHSSSTAFAELPESPGKFAIVPKSLEESQAFHRIVSEDESFVMPPPEFKVELTNYEKAVLIKWIKDGAEYKPHWAFVKPEKSKLPKVKNEGWAKNEIDNFILSKLESEKLSPSYPSDKSLLLRRLSLDLIGLPPSKEEIEAFESDGSEDAYEKQVDRLLASPHYGERMATDWMDVARFSDTYGYQVDYYRDMSPWRDWVIDSYNQNRPYDEFLHWQIAGDLFPDASKNQILSTGYNRLHSQNSEDGIVEEEYRVEHVVDRTSVISTGIMGLTVACARCHDHKYDPISQKEFYELYSFFNNVNESGQISRDPLDIPVPTMLLPNENQEEVIAFIENLVAKKEQDVNQKNNELSNKADDWIDKESYQNLGLLPRQNGKAGYFSLNGHLGNSLGGRSGKMALQYVQADPPQFNTKDGRKALMLDGDAWLDLKPVGIYKRNEPFSIGLWMFIPGDLEEGVIFHKNKGVRLHGFKGYHLYYKKGKLEAMLAHTWPDNAIIKQGTETVPTDRWVHFAMTYDGSSKSEGVKVFVNGIETPMTTMVDNLYKDIVFNDYEDEIYAEPLEPGLKVGGRWRGFGIKNGFVDDIEVFSRELSRLEVMAWADNEDAVKLLSKTPAEISAKEKMLLKEHYITHHREYNKKLDELKLARQQLVDSVDRIQEVMVMKEMDKPRQAYLLVRGQYDNYGEEVFPNTPEAILPYPDDLPKNRLGFIQWLTHRDHPLTARVAVNRYWQKFFGQGLVSTSEDFGNQGALPSHPKLLDWLAVDFMESGWDIKAVQKKIVMSATYQQNTITTPELRELDPQNILLARGPKVRLTGEMIRDNALASSGLLVDKIGGESVKPYQPPGLWQMNANSYTPDKGENLYRRSLYTLWKKTVPNPTQATFDQPDRNDCTMKRQKTNTPLQALVLLNDPTYVEASRKIGETIAKANDPGIALVEAFIGLTGRQPDPKEVELLKEVQSAEYEKFKEYPDRAKGWLETGEYQIDQSLDSNWVAANAVVASVIINTDAFIMKR